MYSLTRVWIASHEAKMQIGVRNVDSSTKNRLMPSMPTRYAMLKSGNHGASSTNWKADVPVSNPNHRNRDTTKVMPLVHSAT